MFLYYQKKSFKHDSIQINCLYVRCVYKLDFDYLLCYVSEIY